MNTALAYGLLGLAILSEIIATTALKASDGMTRMTPGVLVVVGYALAFWLLALTLRSMPVGFVYGVWSGLGVVGVAITGALFFGETLGAVKILGVLLIVAGVVLLKAGST